MKNKIQLFALALLCTTMLTAQAQVLCHSDGPSKTTYIEVLSNEDTSALSGHFSFQFQLKSTDTSSIDSIRLNLGDWFISYSLSSYTSSMLKNDS